MADFLRVDRAGRVVIPKSVRDRYGLGPGRRLELTDTGDELRLRPESSGTGVVRHADGSIEFTGHLPSGFDITEAITRLRAERASMVLGGGE